jgi:hypothetical protein
MMPALVFDNADAVNLEKPKKPLSAYNLFFRFERKRLLNALEINMISIVKSEDGIIFIEPREHGKSNMYPHASSFNIDAIRELIGKVDPMKKDGKRKKSHGKIGFTDMIKYMCKSWNDLKHDTRQVFYQLASEEKQKYLKQLQAYNKARYDSVNGHFINEYTSLGSNSIEKEGMGRHYNTTPEVPSDLFQPTKTGEISETLRLFLQTGYQEKNLRKRYGQDLPSFRPNLMWEQVRVLTQKKEKRKFKNNWHKKTNKVANPMICKANRESIHYFIENNHHFNGPDVTRSDSFIPEITKSTPGDFLLGDFHSRMLKPYITKKDYIAEEKDLAVFLSDFDWETF